MTFEPDNVSVTQSLECDVHLRDDGGRLDDALLIRIVDIPEQVLGAEGEDGAWDISIRLTTDEQLRQLHAEFLEDDTVTDVMSFLYGDVDLAGLVTFGEIVISVDRASDQAAAAGWPLESELAFLLTHGMLHLCGWEDSTDEQRNAMHARQHDIMKSLQFT
jgi:rRNA maturation RNase YbeY